MLVLLLIWMISSILRIPVPSVRTLKLLREARHLLSKCRISLLLQSGCHFLYQVIKEQGLDPFDALEAVRQATADATPDEAFLGGGDVRVGEFILLVDSDTRIPQDCILPTVSELLDSAEVAFTQHLITPMQVSV